jgi:glutamyl-tRNA reductase
MSLSKIFVIGFSHHNANVHVRTIASIGEEVQKELFRQSLSRKINSLMILNTCNRTEIYGIGEVEEVKKLLLHVAPELSSIADLLFVKKGEAAVNHLLKVASGLDSKIIGDLEILSQFRKSIVQSKNYGMINGAMEKLTNYCIAAAKEVRAKTRITTGSVSSSYAVVKKIKNSFYTKDSEILIIGTGNYGVSVAKNVIQHLPVARLTICNRTNENALALSKLLNVNFLPFNDLITRLNQFNIIISCISKDDGYIINPEHVDINLPEKWFFDLSVPLSVNPKLTDKSQNFFLYNIDDISLEIQSTIDDRISEIPKANEIISNYQKAIINWLTLQDYSWMIREWKNHLKSVVSECPENSNNNVADRDIFIEQSIKKFALFIKNNCSNFSCTDAKEIFQRYTEYKESTPVCVKQLNLSEFSPKYDKLCRTA